MKASGFATPLRAHADRLLVAAAIHQYWRDEDHDVQRPARVAAFRTVSRQRATVVNLM